MSILKIHNKKIFIIISQIWRRQDKFFNSYGFSKKGFVIFFYKYNTQTSFYKDLLKDKSLKFFCLENRIYLNLVSVIQFIKKIYNSFYLIINSFPIYFFIQFLF